MYPSTLAPWQKNHLFHRDPSGIGGWWHKHNTCTNIVYQCITLSVFFLNPRGQEDQEMVSKISTWMWSKQLGMVLKTQEQNGKGRVLGGFEIWNDNLCGKSDHVF